MLRYSNVYAPLMTSYERRSYQEPTSLNRVNVQPYYSPFFAYAPSELSSVDSRMTVYDVSMPQRVQYSQGQFDLQQFHRCQQQLHKCRPQFDQVQQQYSQQEQIDRRRQQQLDQQQVDQGKQKFDENQMQQQVDQVQQQTPQVDGANDRLFKREAEPSFGYSVMASHPTTNQKPVNKDAQTNNQADQLDSNKRVEQRTDNQGHVETTNLYNNKVTGEKRTTDFDRGVTRGYEQRIRFRPDEKNSYKGVINRPIYHSQMDRPTYYGQMDKPMYQGQANHDRIVSHANSLDNQMNSRNNAMDTGMRNTMDSHISYNFGHNMDTNMRNDMDTRMRNNMDTHNMQSDMDTHMRNNMDAHMNNNMDPHKHINVGMQIYHNMDTHMQNNMDAHMRNNMDTRRPNSMDNRMSYNFFNNMDNGMSYNFGNAMDDPMFYNLGNSMPNKIGSRRRYHLGNSMGNKMDSGHFNTGGLLNFKIDSRYGMNGNKMNHN